MKIRDAHAIVNGNKETTDLDSGGLQIIADDGHTLLTIYLDGNVLKISSGNMCKHAGKILDDRFSIKPVASNMIELVIDEYTEEGS